MLTKHIAAECKRLHTTSFPAAHPKHAPRKRLLGEDVEPKPLNLALQEGNKEASFTANCCATVGVISRQVSTCKTHTAQFRDTSKMKVNGWHVCLQEVFQEPIQPGESKQDRYNRPRLAAPNKMKNPMEREVYASKEREHEGGLLSLLGQQTKKHYGPWQLGDAPTPWSSMRTTRN